VSVTSTVNSSAFSFVWLTVRIENSLSSDSPLRSQRPRHCLATHPQSEDSDCRVRDGSGADQSSGSPDLDRASLTEMRDLHCSALT
jgi:hypothetical protein